jgi:hypothetical protein
MRKSNLLLDGRAYAVALLPTDLEDAGGGFLSYNPYPYLGYVCTSSFKRLPTASHLFAEKQHALRELEKIINHQEVWVQKVKAGSERELQWISKYFHNSEDWLNHLKKHLQVVEITMVPLTA